MHRTQVYLTNSQKIALKYLTEQLHKTQSEILRIALDTFIESVEAVRANQKAYADIAKALWTPDYKIEECWAQYRVTASVH